MSLLAAIQGTTEVIVGNVIGSNITNILLILGIAAVIVKRSNIKYNFLEFDLPLFITSAFFLAIALWDGTFSLFEGIVFLLIFAVYMIHSISNYRKRRAIIPQEVREAKKEKLGWDKIAKVIISPIFIYLGAKYTVTAVIWLSGALNLGADVIAASAIALGTSLPELTVSFVTIKRGKIDEMLGNIIGSNIFNSLFVMSIPALFIGAIAVPTSMIVGGLPIMIAATALFFVFARDRLITRGKGIVLLLFYLFFLARIFNVF